MLGLRHGRYRRPTEGTPTMEIAEIVARLETLEAEREILATINAYVHGIDYGPPEDWADCFTEDGTYEVIMPDGSIRETTGRAALHEFAANHPTPPEAYYKHFVIAPSIELRSDTATVRSVMGRIDQTDGGPVIDVFGRYLDELVKCDDGRWRFSRRKSFVEALGPSFASATLSADES